MHRLRNCTHNEKDNRKHFQRENELESTLKGQRETVAGLGCCLLFLITPKKFKEASENKTYFPVLLNIVSPK